MTGAIQHVVMLSLDQPQTLTDVQEIMLGLDGLRSEIPGFETFVHGPNLDFEQKSKGYDYGFVCTFADKGALQTYADHPDHKALGARLVALCQSGADGIWVADIVAT